MKRATLVLLMLFTSVSTLANKNEICKTLLTMRDVQTAFGKDVFAQPVFSDRQQRGWRLYGVKNSPRLVSRGVTEGSLMTHVCGIYANDVLIAKGDICCPVDASREFEITVRVNGETKSFRVARP